MKKWFSFALALALCFTTVLGGIPAGLAEETPVVTEAVDPQYADTEQDLDDLPDDGGADDTLPIDADGAEALESDAAEAVEMPPESAEASVEADLPLEQDGAAAFTPWYAAALASLTLEMDEVVSCIIPEGTILLVTGQAGEGLLNVACGQLTGVVDATALMALTEDELHAFMDEMALTEEVALYQGMLEYPLPPVPAQPVDEPAPEADPVPVCDPAPVADPAPVDANPGEPEPAEGAEAPDDEAAECPSEASEDAEAPVEQNEKKADADDAEEKEATDGAKEEGSSDTAEKSEDAEAAGSAEKSEDAETADTAEAHINAEASENPESAQSAEAAAEGAEATATDQAAAAQPAFEPGVPASISVNVSAINLGVKEKFSGLTATVVDGGGTPVAGAAVNWASSNVRVVRVDAAGKLTAVRKGKATIVIRADGLPEALVTVVVKGAPSKVTLKPKKVQLCVGMTWQLAPKFNKGAASAGLTFTSSNPVVAQVNEAGIVTAVSPGKAYVTVSTFNKKKARVRFTVTQYALPADMVMSAQTVTIGVKEKHPCLGYTLVPPEGQENCEATIKWKSKNAKIAKVNAKTGVITGVKAGTTTIIATTNNKISRKVKVVVIKQPKSVVLTPKSMALTVGMTGTLTASYNGKRPADNLTYASSNPGVATVDASGTVTAVADGTAVITATTYNNKKDYCNVTVGEVQATEKRYRMFAAYNFYNVLEKGSLYFPKNNATSFQKVLASANIDGVRYENVGILENASKDSILSGMVKAFSDSRDTDVSVVYLCSHGYNYIDKASSGATHFGLQLPGYTNYNSSSEYYITAEEIFNAVSSIRGQVVLVVDSCFSGQFITNMKSSLDAEGGRIAVMTAASNTKACYYCDNDTENDYDFFTYYLLEGAGHDMHLHTNSGAYPADSNADGKLTFNEMFSYAKKNVKANMSSFSSKSWFHGDASQTPNSYEGYNGELVLFQYK